MNFSMKSDASINKSIIICLLVGMLALSPFSSYCLEVNIESGEGVSQEVVRYLENEISLVENFFKDVYGLDINYPIKIYLTSGKESYIEALGTEFGISRERAEKYHYNASGSTLGHTIVADIKACRGQDGLLELVAHELTHQYQMLLYAGKGKEMKWLSEGTADIIAVSILAKNGRGSVNNMARNRMKALQAVPRVPELSQMHSAKDWRDSANRTGLGVNYYTSDMAVICLVSKVGYEPLFTYFKLLGKTNVQQAFREAFGMSIEDYEAEFREYLVDNGVTI